MSGKVGESDHDWRVAILVWAAYSCSCAVYTWICDLSLYTVVVCMHSVESALSMSRLLSVSHVKLVSSFGRIVFSESLSLCDCDWPAMDCVCLVFFYLARRGVAWATCWYRADDVGLQCCVCCSRVLSVSQMTCEIVNLQLWNSQKLFGLVTAHINFLTPTVVIWVQL